MYVQTHYLVCNTIIIGACNPIAGDVYESRCLDHEIRRLSQYVHTSCLNTVGLCQLGLAVCKDFVSFA